MIKAASALLIVALSQFNSSLKHKEILPKKFDQIFVDKPYKLPDSKGGKRQSKPLSLTQKKSLKKLPQVQYFSAHNSVSHTEKTFQTNLLNPALFALEAQAAAPCRCCMSMSA